MKALCQYLDGVCSQCHRELAEGRRRTCPAWQALDPIPVDKSRPVVMERMGRPAGPIPVVKTAKKGCCGEKKVNPDDPPELAPAPPEE